MRAHGTLLAQRSLYYIKINRIVIASLCIAERERVKRHIGMQRMNLQKRLTESEFDEFAELLRLRQAEQAMIIIKDYCRSHKSCTICGLYNGSCRVNMIPSDWDIPERKEDERIF